MYEKFTEICFSLESFLLLLFANENVNDRHFWGLWRKKLKVLWHDNREHAQVVSHSKFELASVGEV